MNFENIFKYQEIDQQLLEKEKEFESNEVVANYKKNYVFIQQATQVISKYKANAETLDAAYEKACKELEELKKDLDVYKSLEETDDISEIDFYLKKLNDTLNKINALEKEFSKLKSDINTTVEDHNSLFNQGVQKNKELRAGKDEFAKLSNDHAQLKAQYEKKLAELAPSIPSIFLEKYKSLKKEGKLPVFVEYDPDSQKGDPICPRCRMGLFHEAKTSLKKQGDFVECPNCHRVLVVLKG